LLFFGLTINSGIDRGLETYRERFGADILVVPKYAPEDLDSVYLLGKSEKSYFNDKIIRKLKAIKGVKKASPQVFLESASSSCCSTGRVFLIGFDPATDFVLRPWVGTRQTTGIGADDIIIGANIIQPVGARLSFYNHRFRIVAKLDRTGLGIYDNAVYLPIKTAYKMAKESRIKPGTYRLDLEKGSISTILIQLEKNVSSSAISRKIEKRFPSVKAVRMAGLGQAVKEKLPRLKRTFLFWLVAVWASTFLFISIVFYLFNQIRRREYGIFQAIGGSKKDLIHLVLLESGILTIFGGLIGVYLAVAVMELFYEWTIASLKVPLLYPSLGSQLLTAFLSVAIVLIVGLTGAAYPAYLTASKEPYECIRYNG
jgi:putative ABC transport system permease protein